MVYRRILIVGEISPEDKAKLTEKFDKENWGYYDVKSGTDASNLLERDGYDAMVLNMEIPGISSRKILEKAHNKGTPTIVIGTKKEFKEHELPEDISSRKVIKSKTFSENLEDQIRKIFSEQARNIHRIGILGTGKIGTEVANYLVTSEEGLATHIFLYNGSNKGRAEALESSLKPNITKQGKNIETFVCEDKEGLMKNCGIIVCAIGKSEKERTCTSRAEVLGFYIDQIKEYAKTSKDIGQAQNTNWIMVTNSPCPLSLVYYIYSDKGKVEASLVVDETRAKYIMSEWAKDPRLKLDIPNPKPTITMIGPHNTNRFVAEARINGVKLELLAGGSEFLDKAPDREDYRISDDATEKDKASYDNLLRRIEEYGNQERVLNKNLIMPLTVAQGVIDQIRVIIKNGRITTGIHKLLDTDPNYKDTDYAASLRGFLPNGIFTGWPVEYNDFSAYPLEVKLEDRQKEHFYLRMKNERMSLYEALRDMEGIKEVQDFFLKEQKQYRNGNNGN